MILFINFFIQINEKLREYQDKNGELGNIVTTANRGYAIIQYDA